MEESTVSFRTELRAVLLCIDANALPKDDTMLEKLYSVLDGTNINGLWHDDDLIDILKQVAKNENIEPGPFAAILRVISPAVNAPSVLDSAVFVRLVKKCYKSDYVDDPSVSYAWLTLLSRITAIGSKGIHWLVKEGCLERIVHKLHHKSVFVCNAAKKLLSKVFCKTVDDLRNKIDSITQENDGIAESYTQVVTLLSSVYNNMYEKKIAEFPDRKCYIDLFNEVILIGDVEVIREIEKICDKKLVDVLCHLLEDSSFTDTNNPVLKMMSNLHKIGLLEKGEYHKLVQIPNHISSKGRKPEAICISVWILQNLEKEHTVTTEDFILNPVTRNDLHRDDKLIHSLCMRYFMGLSLCVHHQTDAVEMLCDMLLKDKICSTSLSLNPKLQRACIDALNALIQDPSEALPEDIATLIECSLTLLRNTVSCCQLVSKSLQLTENVIRMSIKLKHSQGVYKSPQPLEGYFQELGAILPILFMNIKWEIRDSALQFLSRLASIAKDSSEVTELFKQGKYAQYIYQGLEDGESYVRATAISTLQTFLLHDVTNDILWCVLDQSEVFMKLEEIARNDTEAFPRRAVVELYSATYLDKSNCIHKRSPDSTKNGKNRKGPKEGKIRNEDMPVEEEENELKAYCESQSSLATNILTMMSEMIDDNDWQVKVTVVEFWEKFIKSSIVENVQDRFLAANGAMNTDLVPDYAKELLNQHQIPVDNHEITDHNQPTNGSQGLTLNDLCKLKVPQVLMQSLYDYDKAVKLRACELYKLIVNHYDIDPPLMIKKSSGGPDSTPIKDKLLSETEFISLLENVDIGQLQLEAETSDDQYANNPHSLFTDLLVAMRVSKSSEDIVAQDNASSVDCY